MNLLRNALSKIATAWAESVAADDDGTIDDKDIVPQSAFEAAVADAASSSYGVRSARVVGGSSVAVTFYSQSRKQTWDSHIDFDLDARTFQCTSPYGSGRPRIFGEAVLSKL